MPHVRLKPSISASPTVAPGISELFCTPKLQTGAAREAGKLGGAFYSIHYISCDNNWQLSDIVWRPLVLSGSCPASTLEGAPGGFIPDRIEMLSFAAIDHKLHSRIGATLTSAAPRRMRRRPPYCPQTVSDSPAEVYRSWRTAAAYRP